MKWQEDARWSAWLDDELELEEAKAFEQSLDESGRAALEQERVLDSLIMERVAGSAPCPDELWQRVQQDLWEAGAEAERARFGRARLAAYALPLAAAALLMFALLVPANTRSTPTFLKIAGASEPAAEASADSSSHERVEQFIRQQGIGLSLAPVPPEEAQAARPLVLHGAQYIPYEGETVVQLVFTCGGNDAAMVIARRGGAAEQAIMEALREGRILLAAQLETYIAAVIGHTDRPECLIGMISSNGAPAEIIKAPGR